MTFLQLLLYTGIFAVLSCVWIYFFSYFQAYGWKQGFGCGIEKDYKKYKRKKE